MVVETTGWRVTYWSAAASRLTPYRWHTDSSFPPAGALRAFRAIGVRELSHCRVLPRAQPNATVHAVVDSGSGDQPVKRGPSGARHSRNAVAGPPGSLTTAWRPHTLRVLQIRR